jgi:hypothetical protein
MKQNLYCPPNNWYNPQDGDDPLVFLAGPILGADDWQSQAIQLIHDKNPNIIIANPRRDKWDADPREFEVQIAWETNHLRLASAYGAIMFWLAKETSHICDRAFAQTSRFELAEWLTHYKYRKQINPDKPIKLVLGIDNDFPGRKYILSRLFDDCPEFVVATTLEDTCQLMTEVLK